MYVGIVFYGEINYGCNIWGLIGETNELTLFGDVVKAMVYYSGDVYGLDGDSYVFIPVIGVKWCKWESFVVVI